MVNPPLWLRIARKAARPAALATLALTLAACSAIEIDSPLTTFKPEGPFSERINGLFWPVFWIATGIFAIVQLGILLAIWRYRDRPGAKEPKQTHGNAKLEVLWTVIPALILAGIAIPTVQAVFDLTECGPSSMRVDVIAHQWWFEYRYPDGVETANVMVIPAGQEVCAHLTSADVIHNFWIPALNGKRYMIPGHETVLRLQSYEPGEFWGHCAEFCGMSHSLMRARVLAVPPDQFAEWLAAQAQPAAVPPEGSPAAEGWALYQEKGCTGCHVVATAEKTFGPPADAFHGPRLTHFASRSVFAGATLPYEGVSYEDALKEWLTDPPKYKPGSYMPNLSLTDSDINSLISWLETLK